ncbi:MAG: CinA family protein [Planctomycetales bacterium]
MSVESQAKQLAAKLTELNLRVVFAESCTAGLVAASLARVPGVSEHHCGSAVTYREKTKQVWLGVSADDLEKYTAVSEPVAEQMAVGVLKKTPEAHWSASVTGHLGPNAPPEQDGLIYVGLARRVKRKVKSVEVLRVELQQQTRLKRQREAAETVLRILNQQLDAASVLD